MRILIATGSRTMVGGIEKYVHVLLPALLARGHEVAVLYEHSSQEEDPVVDPAALELQCWYWDRPDHKAVLRQELAEWNPDFVYAHGFQSIELENLLLDTLPMVLFAHVYHGTCITGRKCHAFPTPQPCDRQFGAKCLALYYPRRCGGLNPLRAWQLYQINVRRVSRLDAYRGILVASQHMYDEFRKHGVSPEKLYLVPLPITDDGPPPKPPEARSTGDRILFVGRLWDLKGGRQLVEAIPMAAKSLGRALTLTVAGDGPERQGLEQLAVRLGLKTDFVGTVDASRRVDLMRNANLLAVPSVWPEPFGLVGIEGGCLGLPAVAYAVGGIPEWLIPGYSGELAPGDPPTVEGLAAAIVRALANPTHYSELCRGAQEAAQRFSLEIHMDKLESVWRANATAVPAPPAQPSVVEVER